MAFSRAFEEHEVPADLKRIYGEIRTSLDLPFVPTLFKVLAGNPEYLSVMWDDLDGVARSREFQAAAQALGEFVHSLVIRGGWRFSDQRSLLAAQRFTPADMETLASLPPIFSRAQCQMSLFTRLMQRGYAGGQRGRASQGRQASALSRMLLLRVPNERDAGLRAWLIYSDIKKATGTRSVASMFRMLSPFPGYLASVWLDTKRLLADPSFQRAREEAVGRTAALLVGLPVRDHRALARNLAPAVWREIELTVDGASRLLPGLALVSDVWRRSFPSHQMAVA